MKVYSIVRIGNEYVVQAGPNSVLKVASRRKAARLVNDAAELLSSQEIPSQEIPPLAPEANNEPSIDRDPRVIPDPSEAA